VRDLVLEGEPRRDSEVAVEDGRRLEVIVDRERAVKVADRAFGSDGRVLGLALEEHDARLALGLALVGEGDVLEHCINALELDARVARLFHGEVGAQDDVLRSHLDPGRAAALGRRERLGERAAARGRGEDQGEGNELRTSAEHGSLSANFLKWQSPDPLRGTIPP
jgi:hypothetical protein